MVVLHLDNSNAWGYLYNQDGIPSFCLSRLASYVFNLVDKQGITFIPAYLPTHLNVGADYLRVLWFPSGTCSSHSAGCILSVGSTGGAPVWFLKHQLMSALLQLGMSSPIGALGLNPFDDLWAYHVSYMFPPLALVLLVPSKFRQNVSLGSSDFLFLLHHVAWWLLGFPQFSTCWQTILISVPL